MYAYMCVHVYMYAYGYMYILSIAQLHAYARDACTPIDRPVVDSPPRHGVVHGSRHRYELVRVLEVVQTRAEVSECVSE